MKQTDTTTDAREGEILEAGELLEAKHHDVALFQPAADWNNAMLGAFKTVLKKTDIDIDKVKQLMTLQREVQQENAKLEFNAAMARVQARITAVVKNKYNSQTSSWYADLNAICEMVTPLYSAEGFSVSYGTDLSPLEGYTRTNLTLAHHAGFEKVYPLDLPIDNKGMAGGTNKTDIHGIRSSHTYARSILITMAFNIAQKGADDDGNAAGGASIMQNFERISEDQHSRLVDQLNEKNLSPKWLCGKLRLTVRGDGFDSLRDLAADRFETAEAEVEKAKALPPKKN